jgi:hypothetical protein
MCFSAGMSFYTAALLLSIAIQSYRKVRAPQQILLALMPLLFAVQQAAEGFLWILIPQKLYPGLITGFQYVFLTFALIIWPLYIPLTLLFLEKNSIRRACMAGCFIIGCAWSLASLWTLVHQGALVDIRCCHILYELVGMTSGHVMRVLIYCCAVLVPFLVSSSWALRIFGALLGLSCLITYYVWYTHFISVWCFFAALLSAGVLVMLTNQKLLD